ncbi:unnamed protein product [Pleuronectes platessa]|uniref:Uncharacterized protein n=1 Tax=Pleuronectes platessa TaxID=8262 RepID=A0A9N7VVE9_PLEPL|nr:unnamed protein product [Pleuronectes platessa]
MRRYPLLPPLLNFDTAVIWRAQPQSVSSSEQAKERKIEICLMRVVVCCVESATRQGGGEGVRDHEDGGCAHQRGQRGSDTVKRSMSHCTSLKDGYGIPRSHRRRRTQAAEVEERKSG